MIPIFIGYAMYDNQNVYANNIVLGDIITCMFYAHPSIQKEYALQKWI